jgi:hypothetical protein
VRRLNDAHPTLSVALHEMEPHDALALLVRGDVDLVIAQDWVNAPLALPDGLSKAPLLDDVADIALPARHRLAARESIALADLAGEPWISWPQGSICHDWLLHTLRTAGREPVIRHTAAEGRPSSRWWARASAPRSCRARARAAAGRRAHRRRHAGAAPARLRDLARGRDAAGVDRRRGRGAQHRSGRVRSEGRSASPDEGAEALKRKRTAADKDGFAFQPGSTHFLNVDLDIESREPLDALVAAFGTKVSVRFVGSIGRRRCAYVSFSRSYGKTADQLTRALCALVARLPKPARRLWDRARTRRFDVGVEAGYTPRAHEIILEPRTVALVASVGGSILITTYAPYETPTA